MEGRKAKTPLPRKCGVCVARRILTYGPQDSVKCARTLLARSTIFPSDLQLVSWEFFDEGGDTAFQEPGAMRLHMLCDQR